MASIANSGTKLTLKYPDKKNFTFSKFQSEADNESLYEVAKIVNSFQEYFCHPKENPIFLHNA